MFFSSFFFFPNIEGERGTTVPTICVWDCSFNKYEYPDCHYIKLNTLHEIFGKLQIPNFSSHVQNVMKIDYNLTIR